MDAEREKKDGAFTTEEQLEELNTENMFLKRELDYAEKKLAGLGAGDAEDGDDAAAKEIEMQELRKEKVAAQKDIRELQREVTGGKLDINELKAEIEIVMRERDEARVEAEEVKDAIKNDLAELEEEVSQQLTNKDGELNAANEKMDNYERQIDRLEKKCEFLMNENATLTGRDEETGGGGGGGGKDGGGGKGNDEQLMYVKDQLDAVEKRYTELQEKYFNNNGEKDEQVKALEKQIAQAMGEKEELEEKAGYADQLKEWLEEASQEKEDALEEADKEISRLKASYAKEKAIAIGAAVESMEERNSQMELDLDETNSKSIRLDEELQRVLAQNEEYLSEIEVLEISVSQMRFEHRMAVRTAEAGGGTKGGQGFGATSGNVVTDHDREKQALLKQLQGMQQKVKEAAEEADDKIIKERREHNMKLDEMRQKFAKEAEIFAAGKQNEVVAAQEKTSKVEADREQLQFVMKALGKSVKDKEETVAKSEADLRDAMLQLKNLANEKAVVEEQLKTTTADLEEALEIHHEETNAWKEDVQCMRLQKELDEVRAELLALEEQSLQDLEELEAQKQAEFDELLIRKDKEMEDFLNDAADTMDQRTAQKDQERGIHKFKQIMKDSFKKEVSEAIKVWSTKVNMNSTGGMLRQIALLQAQVDEFHATDAMRLDKMRSNMQGDIAAFKMQIEQEKDVARAAQSQLLFITNMAKEQVEQAHGATALTKVICVMTQWSMNCVHGIFEHWRLFTVTEQALRWREKIAQGVMASSSDDKAVNVVQGIETYQAQQENLEASIINELQTEMIRVVESQMAIRKYKLAGMTAESVHELELATKRRTEKEWYVEKMKIREEMEAMKLKIKTEQEVFNEMQAKLYIEKQGLAQQVELLESETTAVRSEFEKRQNDEMEDMMMAREELLNVAYKSGFHMLLTLLLGWNQMVIVAVLKRWYANMYGEVRNNVEVLRINVQEREEQQRKFGEQLEATEYQALIQTTQLNEQVKSLHDQKRISALRQMGHRWTHEMLGSSITSWRIQCVRARPATSEDVQEAMKKVETELFGEVKKAREELSYKTIKVKVLSLGRMNLILALWRNQSNSRVIREWRNAFIRFQFSLVHRSRSVSNGEDHSKEMLNDMNEVAEAEIEELTAQVLQQQKELEELRSGQKSPIRQIGWSTVDHAVTTGPEQQQQRSGLGLGVGVGVGLGLTAASTSAERDSTPIQSDLADENSSETNAAGAPNEDSAQTANSNVGDEPLIKQVADKEAEIQILLERVRSLEDAAGPGFLQRIPQALKRFFSDEESEMDQKCNEDTANPMSSATIGTNEVGQLLSELWNVESELHSMQVDTQALEAEVERLEAELAGEEYMDEGPRLAALASMLAVKRPEVFDTHNDGMTYTDFDLKLLRDSLKDGESLIEEQAEENTALEEEIERLEEEILQAS